MVNKVCGAARGHGGGHFDETLNLLTRDCNRGHELVESPEVVISGREFGVTCVPSALTSARALLSASRSSFTLTAPEMHGSCV